MDFLKSENRLRFWPVRRSPWRIKRAEEFTGRVGSCSAYYDSDIAQLTELLDDALTELEALQKVTVNEQVR